MTTLVRSAVIVGLVLSMCGGPSQARPPALPDRPEVRALRVLHHWDRDRAAAFAAGDVRGLRRLYSRASRAGFKDAAVLRQYDARGLVVQTMKTQVLSVELLDRAERQLTLRIVERFAGGTIRGRHVRTRLPAGVVTARVVRMVRPDDRWLVRGVRRG
jgi:hypothetical protein